MIGSPRAPGRRARLGVSAWRLTGPRTGVWRYLWEVLRHWTPDLVGGRFDRITVYVPAAPPRDLEMPEGVRVRILGPNMRMLAWETLRLGPVADDDVLFCPSLSRPVFARGRTVVTMHEASHYRAPEMFRGSAFYNRFYAWGARRATLVIADNDASARDVARFCGVSPQKIRAVPLAPADGFGVVGDTERARAAVRRRLGSDDPFFLFVGKFSGRRDIPLLLDAFARFASRTDHPHGLVLVGLDPHALDVPARARELGVDGRVHVPGYVPDAELAMLYEAATAFVTPSPWETVSLPVMEALATGTAVLCADNDGMRETTGGGALRVPIEVGSVAEGLERLAADPALVETLGRRGRRHVEQFTWRRTAEATLDVLAEAAGAVSTASPGAG